MTLMRPPATTTEQDAALSNLLESLLAEVPTDNTPTPKPATPQPPNTVSPPAEPAAATAPLNEPAKQPLTQETRVEQPDDDAVPEWANGGFRTLLFRIGELRFGVPLVLMHSVCPYPEDVTKVPSQPAWHRGVFRYRDASTVVADLGVVGITATAADPKYLLVLGDGREAIAIDAIEDSLVLRAEQVRWHRAPGREWLLGLLPDQMCGLLNVDVLSQGIRHR